MNQQVINYLKENKDKYSKEALIKELEKAGYNKKDISEGVGVVFNGTVVAKADDFWDFKSRKIYIKKFEKIKDFLFGFLGIIVINYFLYLSILIIGFIGDIGSLIFYILILGYFFNRRRYIFYGLISVVIVGVILTVLLQ